jgi:hypothetical protein
MHLIRNQRVPLTFCTVYLFILRVEYRKAAELARFSHTKLHIFEGLGSTHDSEGSGLLEDGSEKMVEGETNSPTWKFTQFVQPVLSRVCL